MRTNIVQNLLHTIISNTKLSSNSLEKLGKDNNINLDTIFKDKNVQTILKDLLNDLVTQNKTQSKVLDILKNEPIFKDLHNITKEVQTLIKDLKDTNPNDKNIPKLDKLLVNIKKVDNDTFKQDILNDTKDILDDIQKDYDTDTDISKQTIKLQSFVEYYNLLSISNNSYNTYLPFEWDELEDGNIDFKQSDDEFNCQIFLTLKHYGDIKINLLFDSNKNISISFFTKKDILKEKIQDNLKDLRGNLSEIKVKIQNIYIFDMDKKDTELDLFNNYHGGDYGIEVMA